jgi:Mg-chelatase subunit ChlD
MIGKEQAIKDLETLVAEGQTNLWDGLFHGLEVLKRGNMQSVGTRNMSIFILTDGEPNIIPPRGHVQMLQRYYNQNKGVLVHFELNSDTFRLQLCYKYFWIWIFFRF